jgi:hypothetical protein
MGAICLANQTGVDLTDALKRILRKRTYAMETGIKIMRN